MLGEILNVLHATWNNFLEALTHFLPRLLAMVTILVVGWLIAAIVRFVVRRATRIARITALAERSGVGELLKKADAPSIDRLLGFRNRLSRCEIQFVFLFVHVHLDGSAVLELAGQQVDG